MSIASSTKPSPSMSRDFTWHGRQRFHERFRFATDAEIYRYINQLPAGSEVTQDGFRFIFETDKTDPTQQVLVTVIPCVP